MGELADGGALVDVRDRYRLVPGPSRAWHRNRSATSTRRVLVRHDAGAPTPSRHRGRESCRTEVPGGGRLPTRRVAAWSSLPCGPVARQRDVRPVARRSDRPRFTIAGYALTA